MKRVILFITVFVSFNLMNRLIAQSVSLVYDINQEDTGKSSSVPGSFIAFNNRLYFSASDGIHGAELWEFDGTNFPTMVADVCSGACGSGPRNLTIINNKLYFLASDVEIYSPTNWKLWEFDGVNIPRKVDDIFDGVCSMTSSSIFCYYNNKFYFSAEDESHGDELWEFDGINAPSMVADIEEGEYGSFPSDFIVYDNKLYFVAQDFVAGRELWVYDGVNEPSMVADIREGSQPSYLEKFVTFNNKLFFKADDGIHQLELWVYDGTGAPSMVADINPGNAPAFERECLFCQSNHCFEYDSQGSLFVFNNKLYFAANDSTSGNELWVYDGINPPGMAADINIGTGPSYPKGFTVINDKLYFTAYDQWITCANYDGERRLFSYDGVNTPVMLKNNNIGNGPIEPDNITLFENNIYFFASDSIHGRELWIYDGVNDPAIVADINPLGSSDPDDLILFKNKLYFRADEGVHGLELWVFPDCNSTSSVQNIISCDSYTAPNDTVYTSSGTKTIVIPNAAGCDSIITLNLTILKSTDTTLTVTACDSFYLNGQTYEQSGTYIQTLNNTAGCDSTLVLNLVINTVNASVEQEEGTLTASTPNAMYQWLDCNNNYIPIAGEVNQSFTAQNSGNYAVSVTANNCIDTSACYQVTVVELIENSLENRIIVSPNPVNGDFIIDLGIAIPDGIIDITDVSGNLIKSIKTEQNRVIRVNLNKPAGLYFLNIRSGAHKTTFKLIKE